MPALTTARDDHNQQLEFKLDTKVCGKKCHLKLIQLKDFPVGKCAFHKIKMFRQNAWILFNFSTKHSDTLFLEGEIYLPLYCYF